MGQHLRSSDYTSQWVGTDHAHPAAELTLGRTSHAGDTKPHQQLHHQLATDSKSCRCIHCTSTQSQYMKDCCLMHRQLNCILEYIYTVLLCFHPFLLRTVPQLQNKRAGKQVKEHPLKKKIYSVLVSL